MPDTDLIESYTDFALEILIPSAGDVLIHTYEAFCNGEDIGIETKKDQTPASIADRNAEKIIREHIKKTFPNHGIWGEEFGKENIENEFVWVLDPLDGTREFLTNKPHHFGILIGLLHNRRPCFGVIHDPISKESWTGAKSSPPPKKDINHTTISCTSLSMFDSTPWKASAESIIKRAQNHYNGLNCIGFAKVASGDVDIAIENDLSLHDIVALLPVLKGSGAKVIDFTGQDYTTYTFDLSQDDQKYNIICGLDHNLVDSVQQELQR